MKVFNDITEALGSTPLVQINKLSPEGTRILAKCEFLNPGGSIKDRIALAMIDAARDAGELVEGAVIIEPTSGNTGIGLAMVCACRNYRLILTMPESMSVERQKLLKMFGAEIVLTPSELGMKGAISKARELLESHGGAFMPSQFSNPANPQIHRKTTAREILDAIDSKVDLFVAGVGTGGTLTGCGDTIKKSNPDAQVVAVEPVGSAVLSGEAPGPHKIQGIGAGFIPEVLNLDIVDEVVKVAASDAMETSRRLAREEGLLVGISSGANIFAAIELAKRKENYGKTIVTILCDTGERYLSTELFR